jgi:hypothetical protein
LKRIGTEKSRESETEKQDPSAQKQLLEKEKSFEESFTQSQTAS